MALSWSGRMQARWRKRTRSALAAWRSRSRSSRLNLTENPDILAAVAHRSVGRPRLVIGFAAETDHVIEEGKAKLARKGCDWIVANDVSAGSGVMGGDCNTVHLISAAGVESW